MPKNLFQEIVFTLIMAAVMVYVMVCYNIALNLWTDGEITNDIFVEAFSEWWYMTLIAFAIEIIIAGPLAKKLAFRIVDPAKQAPIVITLTISALTVAIMCPVMSCMATVIIKHPVSALGFATWLKTTFLNFPVALFSQIFYVGPLVRLIFRAIFVYPARHKEKKLAKAGQNTEQGHE